MAFVRHDIDISRKPITAHGMQLLTERCSAHLQALCNCSATTAETHSAQAIAEAVHASPVTIDTDRSTTFALFLQVRGHPKSVVITTEELMRFLMNRAQLAST
ncbi:hypothetical protein ASE30_00170 [Achromobacter sp. Root83]|uniref:hypothetical protein n=1 Tax=Achromobacter sp. Root83 TaxID=1736602 RepID=UPI00070E45BB|nr:hypothetical protein [Achromobacter sp. Root83]KRC85433.1 hypothetical protein ASE30_00170 [Achromobacter sp. Root83]